MVFVPLSFADAVTLRAGSEAARHGGFSGTPSLRRTLGPDVGEEEVDYAALNAAGVAALHGLVGSRRLVVAVEVRLDEVTDRRTGLGEVEVERVRWDQVQALFTDEESAAAAVRAAIAEVGAVPVADALGLPAVVALTDGYDLLWYAPGELDALG